MNERQRQFCEEYLVDLCAAKAARRAGYSPSTARGDAAKWINPEHPEKPELRAEIDRMLAERARRTRVSADRVVKGLAAIAFEDVPDAADEGADSAGDALKKPRRTAASGDSVRTQDKLRALELLGKHLGIFTEHMQLEQVQPVIVDDTGEADEQGEAAESEGEDE